VYGNTTEAMAHAASDCALALQALIPVITVEGASAFENLIRGPQLNDLAGPA